MDLVAVVPLILVEKHKLQTTQLQDTAVCGVMEMEFGGFVRLTTTILTSRVVSASMVSSTTASTTAATSPGFAQL